ncbi:MAG: FMN-binding glutamate synthase family protein, partial [Rhodoferax sp.]|nr:FMN-binding glutamate synthase family protein [Rhodoferax sp.]
MLHTLNRFFPVRYTVFAVVVLGFVGSLMNWLAFDQGAIWVGVWGGLSLLGGYDVLQNKRSLLRNYPVIGRIRYMLEYVRPEIRQYFLESDTEATPFSRAQRSLVYQRAKGESDKHPFGT